MNFEPAYVNGVLISDDGKHIVFLKKMSGPSFLIGKYNFLGGKQETGETHLEAIVREVKEEGGIDVGGECFYTIDYREFEKDGKFYKLENFAAIVPAAILKEARTVEKEPVFYMKLDDVIAMIKENEMQFNYDFKGLLILAFTLAPPRLRTQEINDASEKIIDCFNV